MRAGCEHVCETRPCNCLPLAAPAHQHHSHHRVRPRRRLGSVHLREHCRVRQQRVHLGRRVRRCAWPVHTHQARTSRSAARTCSTVSTGGGGGGAPNPPGAPIMVTGDEAGGGGGGGGAARDDCSTAPLTPPAGCRHACTQRRRVLLLFYRCRASSTMGGITSSPRCMRS